MSALKKHVTSLDIVAIDDGVYAQQVNYGSSASTPAGKSVTDVLARHFEDYAEKFTRDSISNGFIVSDTTGLDVSVSAGNATVKGKWIYTSSPVTVTCTDNTTNYIVLRVGDDGGTTETRIPLADTVSLTAVTSYVDATDLVLAKVVTSGGDITSVTDFGFIGRVRADHIIPDKQAYVKIVTGAHPDGTTIALAVSGSSIYNDSDDAGYFTGGSQDFEIMYSGTASYLRNKTATDLLRFRLGNTNYYHWGTGSAIMDADLIVSGTGNFESNVTISGTLTTEGDVIINSSNLRLNDAGQIGIDSDTNLITMDSEILTLSGSLELQDDKYIGIESDTDLMQLKADTLLLNAELVQDGNLIVSGTSNFAGASQFSGTVDVDGALTVNADITLNSDELILNDNARIGIDSDTNLLTLGSQNLLVSGSIELQDTATIGIESDTDLLDFASDLLILNGSLRLDDAANIGIDSDTNLLVLNANRLSINGGLTLDDNAQIGIDSDTNLLTLGSENLLLSGSLELQDTATIGIESDLDLLDFATNTLIVNGSVRVDTDSYVGSDGDTDLLQFPSSGVLIVNGHGKFNDNAQIGSDTDPDLLTLQNGTLLLSGTLDIEGNTITGTNVNLTNTKLERLDDISDLAMTSGTFISNDGTNWVALSTQNALTQLGLGTITTDGSVDIDQSLATTDNVAFNEVNIGASTNITGVLDEGTMVSNSATQLATQQSIKTYVDAGDAVYEKNVQLYNAIYQLGSDTTLAWQNSDRAARLTDDTPPTGITATLTEVAEIDGVAIPLDIHEGYSNLGLRANLYLDCTYNAGSGSIYINFKFALQYSDSGGAWTTLSERNYDSRDVQATSSTPVSDSSDYTLSLASIDCQNDRQWRLWVYFDYTYIEGASLNVNVDIGYAELLGVRLY